ELSKSFSGESDVMKTYQLVAGVAAGSEGSNELIVRGGTADQNLVLMDDVPLYYVNHIGGFVSVFNEDAIKNSTLIKGGFPARYGGRLSSVLDVRMNDGSLKKWGGAITLGLISSKLHVEGPLIKDKSSIMISGRRSIYDLLMKPISESATGGSNSIALPFYDLNLKANYIFSDRDRIYLSAYTGRDQFISHMKGESDHTDLSYKMESNNEIKWGNSLGALRWNHVFNKNVFLNTILAYTHYGYSKNDETQNVNTDLNREMDYLQTKFYSGIDDIMLKADFELGFFQNHNIKVGGKTVLHAFQPGSQSHKHNIDTLAMPYELYGGSYPQPVDTTTEITPFKAYESALYIEDEIQITEKWSVNAGLRFSSYLFNKNSFFAFEPRLKTHIEIGQHAAISASATYMQQYLHMLINSSGGNIADTWLPSMKGVPPESATQYTLGYSKSIPSLDVTFNISSYYKHMKNLIAYGSGKELNTLTTDIRDKIVTGGKGESYGMEFMVQKQAGDFSGWLSYTLSKTTRQFADIEDGRIFPYKYDRRHNLNVTGSYQLNKKITFSASWVLYSGGYTTVGLMKYPAVGLAGDGGQTDNPQHWISEYHSYFIYDFFTRSTNEAMLAEQRNNYELPYYHRLDVSAHFTKQKKRGTRIWVLGVYNTYNKMNPYYVFYEDNKLKKFVLFGAVPFVSYQFKF
nr:TonB-dependent receptor [Salinivirgaceae bacterium]